MAINFPASPSLDQEFTSGDITWKYNGVAWEILSNDEPTFTAVTTTDLTVTGTVTGINLNDLSDVTISGTPTEGQVLAYQSGQWSGQSATFNGGTITNPLRVNNATASTSSTTGALRLDGGIGVVGNMFIGGSITIEDENLNIKTSGELRLHNTANTGYVGFSAPNTISADKIYVLPQQDGSSGHFLRTNGSGVLSWAAVTSPSGGTPPGGSDTQVQYNDSDEFGGSASFTFDSGTNTVTVPILTATGKISTSDTTASTDETTGSIVADGGIGIAGQLNVAGATNTFTGNTASTSTTTGTIVVTGGVGVSGAINIGSNATADTAPSNADHLTNKRYVDAQVLAFSVAFGA